MTEPLRAALAVGKTFTAFLRDGAGQRPDLPPGDGRGLPRPPAGACATEPRSEHVHRIADGRWVRVRENRGADGSRVLVTTDITEERHRDDAAAAARRSRSSRRPTRWRSPAPTTASPSSTTPSRPPPATARPRCSAASRRTILSSGVHPPEFFDGDAPRAGGRPGLARHHRQPPPRRPPDRAGDHDRAAARRGSAAPRTTSRSSATSPRRAPRRGRWRRARRATGRWSTRRPSSSCASARKATGPS